MNYPEIFKETKEYDPGSMTAWHEGGHIICSLHFGVVPSFASILPGYDSNGSVARQYHSVYPKGDPSEWLIALYYGGITGGALYSGIYDYEGARYDLENIEELCERLSRDPLDMWLKTHRIISDNEKKLYRIAEDLIKHRALSPQYMEML